MPLRGALIGEAWAVIPGSAPLGAGVGVGACALMRPLSHTGRGVHHTLRVDAVFQ